MINLFKEHLASRINKIHGILNNHNFDQLIIETGEPDPYFLDDQDTPFRPNPHFAYLCPAQGPGHVLQILPGKKPKLFFYSPQDFWHESSTLIDSFWNQEFDISFYEDAIELWDHQLKPTPQTLFISPQPDYGLEKNAVLATNSVLDQLSLLRVQKTTYEIHCLQEASLMGARGHLSAKTCFLNGGNEIEIFYAFLMATGLREIELPYNPIIGLNEKSAVLHYQNLRRLPIKADSFLIDAGAKFLGYCSDITRTYSTEGSHTVFKSLIKATEDLQLQLCNQVQPGINYEDIHNVTHTAIIKILIEHQILTGSFDEISSAKLSHLFFPHGVGHALGLLVHDVGGKPNNIKSEEHPYLRTLRLIEENDVLTIEPGIYFIPMLLEPWRKSKNAGLFNWKIIDELIPMGGIRIEDNVVAKKNAPINLTRKAFSQLTS